MIYTDKIKKAIDFAARAHEGQKRKSTGLPYVIHPLSVALALSESGANEDIIVAGLLHDAVEDTEATNKEIEAEFGPEVAKIVDDLTEQDKGLPWEKRKELAISHIPSMGKDSLLAKSADVLCNLADFVSEYHSKGEKIMDNFSASKEKQLARYENLFLALEEAWKENPLLPELKDNLREFRDCCHCEKYREMKKSIRRR